MFRSLARPILPLLCVLVSAAHAWAQGEAPDTTPTAVVQRFVDAANARNLDAMMATMADDVVFVLLPTSQAYATTRDSVRAMYVRVFQRVGPGFKVQIASRIADGPYVVDFEKFTNATGQLEGQATWIYLVTGGLIRRAWSMRPPRRAP